MKARELTTKEHKLTTGYLFRIMEKILDRRGIKIEATDVGEEADSIDCFTYFTSGQKYIVIGTYINRGEFIERKGNQLIFDKFILDYHPRYPDSEITIGDSITIDSIVKS